MHFNRKILIIVLSVFSSIRPYGQSAVSLSFQEIPDSTKIVRVPFLELYDNFEKYINKTVEVAGNIDCYFEHYTIRPPINQRNYSKVIWYNLPEKSTEKDFIRLSKYTGYNVIIVATIVGPPGNVFKQEGRDALILQKVTIK